MGDDELERRIRSRLGTTLRGKYHLDAVLGSGGMAAVYAGTHRNGKRFAIKILHAELAAHEDIRKRFVREGYIANSVDHPGAVSVLDDDIGEDGAAFLVMELLTGASLDEIWKHQDRRLAVSVVLEVARQLLAVLAAAHAHSIIHRDIKPANLFITRDGTLKVLDFGIARVRDATVGDSSMTATGSVLGTPAYMAPEQALADAERIDGRTDLWAVGATMFALSAGRVVHEAANPSALLVKAATDRAPDYIALATITGEATPVRISPSRVHGELGREFAGSRSPATTFPIVTLPGDRDELDYELPPGDDYELFLDSRGYYLEWMREAWLHDENPFAALRLLADPGGALRELAPIYKRLEPDFEAEFWSSRYAHP